MNEIIKLLKLQDVPWNYKDNFKYNFVLTMINIIKSVIEF